MWGKERLNGAVEFKNLLENVGKRKNKRINPTQIICSAYFISIVVIILTCKKYCLPVDDPN